MSNTRDKASAFLGGESLQFETAKELWKQHKDENELPSLVWSLLAYGARKACSTTAGKPEN